MIPLSEQTPLGAGRHRKCYTHPDNARRCIKVIYNRDHGGDKEIQRELSYYAHLSRYLTDWSAIPVITARWKPIAVPAMSTT